jgi:hypothetical protein
MSLPWAKPKGAAAARQQTPKTADQTRRCGMIRARVQRR